MFLDEITALCTYLMTANPALENVGYYNDQTDDEDLRNFGITDVYKNYGYIRRETGSDGTDFNYSEWDGFACKTYKVKGTFVLIIDIENIHPLEVVEKALIDQLIKFSEFDDIQILSSGINSDVIYKIETGEEWRGNNRNLIRIRFDASVYGELPHKCVGIGE